MERPLTQKPLIIQDENSAIHSKKTVVQSKSKVSKPISKKGGGALESRKALNDITNKSVLHPEASSKKKSIQIKKGNGSKEASVHDHAMKAEVSSKIANENINIAEEGFLHDHNKCMEAEKSLDYHFWDTVLPGHDSPDSSPRVTEIDPHIDDLKEIDDDWLNSFSWWKSPPRSPVHLNSPPHFTFPSERYPLELILKEEEEACD